MSNPLLAKLKLPGRIFQLPSKGEFYKGSKIPVLSEKAKNGEIEVMPLSGLSEIKLRSPDLLFSGRALREICEECIPDIINPELLISQDVDAVFCFLRIVTYGAEMNISSIHNCEKSEYHDYIVNIEQIVMNPNNKCLDFIDSIYKLKLSNDQVIKLRPVRFQDVIDMTHIAIDINASIAAKGMADERLVQDASIRDLMSIVSEVDGITDESLIKQWVKLLPRKYIDEILEYNKSINQWGFNLNVDLTCKDCGELMKHNLELDPVNFFSG